MRPPKFWLFLALGASMVAVIFVVVRESVTAADEDAWTALDRARRAPESFDAIESAREACASTSAEPWSSLELALALYRSGTHSDLQRALQVAQGAATSWQEHPAQRLSLHLQNVLGTYLAP